MTHNFRHSFLVISVEIRTENRNTLHMEIREEEHSVPMMHTREQTADGKNARCMMGENGDATDKPRDPHENYGESYILRRVSELGDVESPNFQEEIWYRTTGPPYWMDIAYDDVFENYVPHPPPPHAHDHTSRDTGSHWT